MTNNPEIKNKKLSIDALRILACLMVIYLHAGVETVVYGYERYGGLTSFLCETLNYLYCGIPIFYAIIGATVIKKESEFDIKKYLWRICRIIIAIIIFSMPYYLYQCYIGRIKFDILAYMNTFWQGGFYEGAYWYLREYLKILIIVPFLQAMLSNMNKKLFYLFFALIFIFEFFIPLINQYTNSFTVFGMSLTFLAQFELKYIITMYFLMYVIDEKTLTKKNCIILWIIALIFYLLDKFSIVKSNFPYNWLTYSRYVLTISIIFTYRYLFDKKNILNEKTKNVLSLIASTTFGVYLFHMIFKNLLNYIYMPIIEKNIINPILITFIYVILIFSCGSILTFLLKKIPFLNKIL